MSTAFSTIIQDCAKEIAKAEGNWPAVSTATGGTATTIVDTALIDGRTGADDTKYVDAWARIWLAVATVSTEFVRKVTTFAPSSGTLTVTGGSNYDAGDLPSNETYELHYLCHPDELKDAINETLRQNKYRTLYLLSQVADADMEDTTANPPNWTESASQTLTKTTTASKVRFGVQSLRLQQNSQAITEYVASDAIAVVEGEVWNVVALAKCDTGGGKLVAYDNTNAAEIDSWTTDETAYTEIGDSLGIPSGCEALVFRLHGTTITSDVYWDSVWAMKQGQKIFDLPSWITDRSQVKGVFYLPAGTARTNDCRSIAERRPIPIQDEDILEDETAATPFRIQVKVPTGRPVYLDCERPYAELSADADTTTMDRETLVAGALARVYDGKGEMYADQYAKWLNRYNELRTDKAHNRPDVIMVSAYAPYYRQ